MDLQFFISLGAILAFDGLLMGFYAWAAQSSSLKQYRIRTPTTYRIPKAKRAINIGLNGTLSTVYLAAILYHFGGYLMDDQPVSGITVFGEVLAALMLYDFMYYFMHRAMHHPKAMKFIHGVHHYVRFPTSPESIYLHPAENLAGLGLLCIAISIIGPISPLSFLICFFIYSSVNIIVHSNLDLPHPACKLLNFWAKKHDIHHGKHLNRNYASIFPFWDQMFGTAA